MNLNFEDNKFKSNWDTRPPLLAPYVTKTTGLSGNNYLVEYEIPTSDIPKMLEETTEWQDSSKGLLMLHGRLKQLRTLNVKLKGQYRVIYSEKSEEPIYDFGWHYSLVIDFSLPEGYDFVDDYVALLNLLPEGFNNDSLTSILRAPFNIEIQV